jgi:hypothetical protein
MNKKGFIGDAAVVLGVLLVFVVCIYVGAKLFNSFNDSWQDSDQITNESKELVGGLESRYVGLWDGAFMLVFSLLAVGLLVSTAMLGTRPEFFFITIIIAVFFVGVAAAVSNAFSAFSADSNLSGVGSEFVFIPLIMNNLVEIMLVLIGLLLTGLYVKARGLV